MHELNALRAFMLCLPTHMRQQFERVLQQRGCVLGAGWPSLTAVPVWDHLWPCRATFFPPRMDHVFSVDHFFSILYRNLGPPEIFGWWPPCSSAGQRAVRALADVDVLAIDEADQVRDSL